MTIQTQIENIISETGTLFKDKEVFDANYLPEMYKFRDAQLQTMASHYVGITRGEKPNNLFLKGTFATGKSSTVKTFFNVLEQMDSKIKTVHINCIRYNTEYKVMHKIYETIFNTRLGIGSSTHQLFDKTVKKIVKDDTILVVCLDDFNSFSTNKELNTTLYNLLRASESYCDARISLVTISSDDSDMLCLDPNVATIYRPNVIDFPSYSRGEIFEILRQRCVLGFYPGVVGDDVVGFVADRTWDVGDLRFGINRLRSMGERAEFLHDDVVVVEHF